MTLPTPAILLALLATAASAAAAPVAPAALVPSTPWVVAGEGGECILQRTYSSAAGPVALVFRADPFDAAVVVLLVAKRGLPRGMGGGKLLLSPAARTVAGYYLGDQLADGRGSLKLMPHDDDHLEVKALDGVDAVTVLAGSTRLAFATPGLSSGAKALDQCNALLTASWGVDPHERETVRTRATMTSPKGAWIGPSDYASDALAHGVQGDTRILFAVDETGKPHDCRTVVSSGVKALDLVACSTLIARARFSPALDAAGRPVASHKVERVSWRVGL